MLEIIGSKKRLEILKHLSREDRYVSELMELTDMDGKRTKHHLEKLEGGGIIESYKEGRRRYYRLIKDLKLEVSAPPEGKFLVYVTED
ncbi:MAG: ArsR/SmtB family transcription factor [Candidatus Aenigmatarchaeota archaeon]